ncbi:LAFE_0F00628g1_1 [Lachancea fermentati]|uniref:Ubiquitin carboxyl-terminal hydrolase n=1 Tax=Lachancea fermentati TaxID=4955 RepID=A0A1G4MEE0_LACFM|nr:LAFE_0F00628g1_1 [Lachancea fermentati]
MVQSFTPEYSNELFKFVQEVYSQDIAHYFPKLKLEKLIDLLEHAEYLFESYRNLLNSGQNDEALTAFVIGCFYIFLIVPHSIQFHSRNKSYGIYSDLKKYYQEESNMTNVLLMVTNKIDSLLKTEIAESEAAKITRRRAYSVPSKSLEKQLRLLQVSNAEDPLPEVPGESNSDNESTMWTAPQLDPNDQLKLALAPAISPSSSASSALNEDYSRASRDSSLPPLDDPEMSFTRTMTEPRLRHASIPTSSPSSDDPDTLAPVNNIYSQDVDRFVTHRKDSYHSVYMMNEDYDDDLIFNLTRLQKQSVITCDKLMDILNGSDKNELLLVDLRLAKRFKRNHLVAHNIVNIDPKILWDSQTHAPLYSDSQLESVLANPTFNDRAKFKHIVYYTDMSTFLHVEFDYQLVFFQLLYTSSTELLCVPKVLLGGYEQWKKYISTYASNHSIDKNDYLYRPSHAEKKLETPPIPKASPPAIPHPTTAPPPLPSVPPPQLESTKPLPENKLKRAPMPLPEKLPSNALNVVSSAHHHRHPKNNQNYANRQRVTTTIPSLPKFHVSVPTIEQSPNAYVALSITGLRNLGSTCYINSMLQCLFATRSFRDIFLSSKYQEYFSHNYHKPNQLSKSFNMLFKKMYMNGGCSVVPTGFLKACNALRPDLKIPYDQQDTQEFLLFLLSQLHDELSDPDHVAADFPNLVLHDDDQLKVDHKEYNKWFENNIMKNGISPIDDIFQGQMENSLQCERCGYCSYNYSIFYVLSLAIPSHSSTFGKSKKVKLEDCINLFTSDEELTGENAWDCPKCGSAASGSGPEGDKKRKRRFLLSSDHPTSNRSKFFKLHSRSRSRSESPFGRLNNNPEKWKSKKLSTIKTLNFITLPPVLTIHLSRFYYDLTKKNNTVVTYPLILSIVLKNDEVVNYRLYAIVNHFGNLISGHYTSLVNKDLRHGIRHGLQKWYYFDDEVVKRDNNHGDFDAGITGISSSDVYVLFYERINE